LTHWDIRNNYSARGFFDPARRSESAAILAIAGIVSTLFVYYLHRADPISIKRRSNAFFAR
jgi:hypothetical protein